MKRREADGWLMMKLSHLLSSHQTISSSFINFREIPQFSIYYPIYEISKRTISKMKFEKTNI